MSLIQGFDGCAIVQPSHGRIAAVHDLCPVVEGIAACA